MKMENKQDYRKRNRREASQAQKPTFDIGEWKPRTLLGKKVKSGEITDIAQILDEGKAILEQEIIDALLPNLESDLLLIGQAKGKFGGGKRRAFRQTQKKSEDGNVPSFSTMAVVGNKDGYVGIGLGKSKETIPAREKALRKAKLNVIKIRRGCGSWECGCKTPHSIPFEVTGKCGSCELTLIPAPKGTGLCVEKECQKILRLAGIKDVWSQSKGVTVVKPNMIMACIDALKRLISTKIQPQHLLSQGIVEGAIKAPELKPVSLPEETTVAEDKVEQKIEDTE